MNNQYYINTKKALEKLGVSIVTLRTWADKGLIDTIRTAGGHRMYNVDKYLTDCINTSNKKKIIKENENQNQNEEKDEKDDNEEKEEKENNIIKKDRNNLRMTSRTLVSAKLNLDSDSNSDSNSDDNSNDNSDDNSNDNSNDNSDDNSNDNSNKINVCYIRVPTEQEKHVLKEHKNFIKKKYPNYKIICDIGSGLDFDREGFIQLIDLIIDKKINNLILFNKKNVLQNGYNFIKYLLKTRSNGKITILNIDINYNNIVVDLNHLIKSY